MTRPRPPARFVSASPSFTGPTFTGSFSRRSSSVDSFSIIPASANIACQGSTARGLLSGWGLRSLLCAAAVLGAAFLGSVPAAGRAAAEEIYAVIGDLPGPGSFDPITITEADFNNTISYKYQVDGGTALGDSLDSGTPGSFIGSWLFGFHLGPDFGAAHGFIGNAAHLDLTLTDALAGNLLRSDFTMTSNATPPGHPPSGTVGGGGRDAGLIDVSTQLVPGRPDQLELLADLKLPTSKVDNEYDLWIRGLGLDGTTSFSITGPLTAAIVDLTPLPAALPLFGAALLALGFFNWRSRRRELADRAARYRAMTS